MVPGLFSAASSMRADERNHEIIAANLANASLPGYRRQVPSVESFGEILKVTADGQFEVDSAIQASVAVTDFSPGQLVHTGRPLDVALRGDGFFVLDGPQGPIYTRNGTFQVTATGELQSMGGMPVRGAGGPITIPPDATDIGIRADGAIVAGNGEIGRIDIAHFQNPQELIRVGDSLFQAPLNVRPQAGTSTVQQFYREMSNVSVVDEMVQMIAGMRHYEASQRALRTISDSIQLNTRPQTG